MIILVSDTSVLIDLERGGLLEQAFACGLTMVVPDLLYMRELEDENGPLLRKLGLGVIALSPDEVEFAQHVRKQRPGLSLPDCFALSCARHKDHALAQFIGYGTASPRATPYPNLSSGGAISDTRSRTSVLLPSGRSIISPSNRRTVHA